MSSEDHSLAPDEVPSNSNVHQHNEENNSHHFNMMGDIEEGMVDETNYSDLHSKKTEDTNRNTRKSSNLRRPSIASTFKSTLHSVISPNSRPRRRSSVTSPTSHGKLRRRRESSFNYGPYQPSSNRSRTSSYKESHSDNSDYDESQGDSDSFEKLKSQVKENTIANSQNYQFEIYPSEMPDLASLDTSATEESQPIHGKKSVVSRAARDSIPDQPIVMKPKRIHQNPLTPQALPQGFTPINTWSRYKAKYHKEWLAEFLGTFMLIILGDGSSIQNVLNQQAKINTYTKLLDSLKNSSNGVNNSEINVVADMLAGITDITQNYNISPQLAWGGAVVAAFFAAGGSSLSGAHLSWCITIVNFLFRGSPKFKLFFPYLGAQLLGGYVGGLTLFGIFHPVILEVFPDWRDNKTFISMFVTVPLDYLSTGRQFISEFTGSFFLVIGIFAMTDPYNNTSPEIFPVLLFILIFTLNASVSLQTSAALNFSRDLGPRLALWTVGVSHSLLFTSDHHYFWVPMVAPILGGILGAFAYDLLIFRGQESWVNKPFYQNISNLKKRARKIKKFLKKSFFFQYPKASYNSNHSYELDSSDDDFDNSSNAHEFNDSDDDNNYLQGSKSIRRRGRRDTDSENIVKFNDNTSLNTTESSDLNPDHYADFLNKGDIGQRHSGSFSLQDIPEEEYSLQNIPAEEYSLDNDLSNTEMPLKDENEDYNYYDNVVSKPKNVFKSYKSSYRNPQEPESGKKKKEISFKSTKNIRKFVPTVEKEDKF
ncbi:hypothetical protein QEN19_003877 [Hanseniaspora menglaensis]